MACMGQERGNRAMPSGLFSLQAWELKLPATRIVLIQIIIKLKERKIIRTKNLLGDLAEGGLLGSSEVSTSVKKICPQNIITM